MIAEVLAEKARIMSVLVIEGHEIRPVKHSLHFAKLLDPPSSLRKPQVFFARPINTEPGQDGIELGLNGARLNPWTRENIAAER